MMFTKGCLIEILTQERVCLDLGKRNWQQPKTGAIPSTPNKLRYPQHQAWNSSAEPKNVRFARWRAGRFAAGTMSSWTSRRLKAFRVRRTLNHSLEVLDLLLFGVGPFL